MSKSDAKAPAGERGTVDANVIKALGHPLRQKILQALVDRVASPSQVAREIEEPLSNVSYHFKILVQCEAVELVRTEPVRGALEHFYRASLLPRLDTAEWSALPQNMRDQIFDQTLHQLWDHVSEAAEAGGFNDPRASVAWMPLDLDAEAFEQLTGELERLTDVSLALQEQSRARAGSDESGLEKTELAFIHYHRA